MVRKELREHIFKMLFQIEFNDPQEMPEQIEYYFSTLEDAADKDKEYIKRKYAAVLEKTEEIDELINANAKGWKTTRMNKVDLSILRLAVYEMKWDDEVPVGVAINEAVELAKTFSSDEAPSFINGVLGKIARSPPAKHTRLPEIHSPLSSRLALKRISLILHLHFCSPARLVTASSG